jgi:hypothetical protein
MPSAIAPLETRMTCLAHLAERCDLLGEARDGGGVDAAPFVGDERRADLDDERGRLFDHFFFSSSPRPS